MPHKRFLRSSRFETLYYLEPEEEKALEKKRDPYFQPDHHRIPLVRQPVYQKKTRLSYKQRVINKYAAPNLPDTPSWGFWEALGNAEVTREAFARGKISTEGRNVDKFLKITYKKNLAKQRALQPAVNTLPEPLNSLLKLQHRDGRFNLAAVLDCLEIPPNVTFLKEKFYDDGRSNYSDDEKACAYAIAEMRQYTELFDEIASHHDKAMEWITGNELLYEAREIIFKYRTNANVVIAQHHVTEFQDGQSEIDDYSSIEEPTELDKELTNMMEQHESNHDGDDDDGRLGSPQLGEGEPDLFSSMLNETSQASVDEKKVYTFDILNAKLHEFTSHRDEVAIQKHSNYLAKLQIEILDLVHTIENRITEIIDCKNRCVALCNSCNTIADRYFSFDELTARLGCGARPVEGVTDWRKDGAPPFRPLIVSFFLKIQAMAEGKLLLQELQDPEKQSLNNKNQKKYSRVRWLFMWQGSDLVLKIMHCLDFLRKCRELSEWYGPEFFFVCNPLMLPYPYYPAYEQFNMKMHVQDQLDSVPHSRKGLANVQEKSGWQHDQYLSRWKFHFEKQSERWAFNWPEMVDLRESGVTEDLFICFLVMYTSNLDTIRKSYEWEQNFISKISSTRGQDELLIGKSSAKVEKKLVIPSAEKRVGHLRKIIAAQQATINEGADEDGIGNDEQKAGAMSTINVFLDPKNTKHSANLTHLGSSTKKIETVRTVSKGVAVSPSDAKAAKMAKKGINNNNNNNSNNNKSSSSHEVSVLESDSSLNSSLEDLKISSPVAVKENAKAAAVMLSSDPARKKSPSLAIKRAQSKLLVSSGSSDPALPNSAENKKVSPSKAAIIAVPNKTAATTNTSSSAATTSKAVSKLKSVANPKLASGSGGCGGGSSKIKTKGSLSTTRAVQSSKDQINIDGHFSVHDNDGDEEDEVGSTNSEREDNAS